MTDPTEDPGVRVSRLARTLTKPQLHEMLVIHRLDLLYYHNRTPLMSAHQSDETYEPLITGGMVLWEPGGPLGGHWLKSKWGIPRLTELGQRVLLCRVEYDLTAAGAIPVERECCDE